MKKAKTLEQLVKEMNKEAEKIYEKFKLLEWEAPADRFNDVDLVGGLKESIKFLFNKTIDQVREETKKEIMGEIEKIEKDGLAIGLEKQSRQIIERLKAFLKSKK